MPDQLPNITFRRGGHPNPRKTILHQQVEDVQSIPVVCLLFAHHRRADLRRITNPQFMPIVTEHLLTTAWRGWLLCRRGREPPVQHKTSRPRPCHAPSGALQVRPSWYPSLRFSETVCENHIL